MLVYAHVEVTNWMSLLQLTRVIASAWMYLRYIGQCRISKRECACMYVPMYCYNLYYVIMSMHCSVSERCFRILCLQLCGVLCASKESRGVWCACSGEEKQGELRVWDGRGRRLEEGGSGWAIPCSCHCNMKRQCCRDLLAVCLVYVKPLTECWLWSTAHHHLTHTCITACYAHTL